MENKVLSPLHKLTYPPKNEYIKIDYDKRYSQILCATSSSSQHY